MALWLIPVVLVAADVLLDISDSWRLVTVVIVILVFLAFVVFWAVAFGSKP